MGTRAKKSEKKRLVDRLDEYRDIEVPYDVWRFLGERKIFLAGDLASFGDDNDYGTKEELRAAIDFYAYQLGGKVSWE